MRGQRTDGRILHTWSLAPEPGEVPQKRGPFWHLRPWPRTLKDADLFTRHEIAAHPPAERAWLIAKEDALPQSWTPPADKVLWAAGTTTWTKLARRGLWCHGSSEGLGSPLVPLVPWIEDMTWARLTHEGAPEENGGRKVATYRLEAKTEWPDFSTFNVFFWPSGEHAREALKRFPDLAVSSGSRSSSISHACGAGATRLTCRHLGLPVKCYLSHKDWLKSLGIDD